MLLFELGPLLHQALAMGGGRGDLDVTLESLEPRRHFALKWNDVLAPHPRERALVVAVQVDQALEGLLLAAREEPVDGALLVGLQVVLEEAVAEVAANGFRDSFFLARDSRQGS